MYSYKLLSLSKFSFHTMHPQFMPIAMNIKLAFNFPYLSPPSDGGPCYTLHLAPQTDSIALTDRNKPVKRD